MKRNAIKRRLKKIAIQPQQILPLLLILIDIGAAIVCFKEKDLRKGVYWIAAAILNITVTF